jgi:hypothetical protein
MNGTYESYEEVLLIFMGMLKGKLKGQLPAGVTMQYHRETPMGPMIKFYGLQHFLGVGGLKVVHRWASKPHTSANMLPLGILIQEKQGGAGYYQVHLPQITFQDLANPANAQLDRLAGLVAVAVMKFIEKLADPQCKIAPTGFKIPDEYGYSRGRTAGDIQIYKA